jgi:hypothetical protein
LPVKGFEVLLKKITVKKILLPFVTALLITDHLPAQNDTLLVKRLAEILMYTQEKNTEKIMDYTYQKLFKIVSRRQMAEAINDMYDTEDFTTDMDSLYALKIHPVFIIDGKEYCKIVHNMVMRMKFKEPLDTAGEDNEADFFLELMGEEYGKENVRFDSKNNTLVIKSMPDMIAVKENNNWYFANYKEDNSQMLDFLFSKAVQKKYQEYQ